MDAVADVEDLTVVVLRLATPRLKYNKLMSEVKKQMEAAPKPVAQGNRMKDFGPSMLRPVGRWNDHRRCATLGLRIRSDCNHAQEGG